MSEILVVRQPVFDRTDSAVGYELRFRPVDDEGDPLARSYLSGSFDVLRSESPAYVRCTCRHLIDRIFDAADPSSLVVLVPPDVGADPDVVAAVEALTKSGVTVAIDEFDGGPEAASASEGLLFAASRAGASGVDNEIARQAVQRARMCEAVGGRAAGLLFLIGLFSLLDAMFRMPLSDPRAHQPRARSARSVARSHGTIRRCAELRRGVRLGLWEQAAELGKQLGVPADRMPILYTDAVQWAAEQLAPNASKAA